LAALVHAENAVQRLEGVRPSVGQERAVQAVDAGLRLALINDDYEEGEEYYHHYSIIEDQHSGRVIEGMEFVQVVLRKFRASSYSDRKMQFLWLRFLTEIDERTHCVDEKLLSNADICSAFGILEESGYCDREMYYYDKFWDGVRMEVTSEAYHKEQEALWRAEGMEKGMAEGLEKGMEKGRLEGERQKAVEIARRLESLGLTSEQIAMSTDLPEEEVRSLA